MTRCTLLPGLATRRGQARSRSANRPGGSAPGLPRWTCLGLVHEPAEAPRFEWQDDRGTTERRDFWPASTIKRDTAIAV